MCWQEWWLILWGVGSLWLLVPCCPAFLLLSASSLTILWLLFFYWELSVVIIQFSVITFKCHVFFWGGVVSKWSQFSPVTIFLISANIHDLSLGKLEEWNCVTVIHSFELSLSKTGYPIKAWEPSHPYYFTHSCRKKLMDFAMQQFWS